MLHLFLVLLFFLFPFISVLSQSGDLEQSYFEFPIEMKKDINDKFYYFHKVRQGHNLYRLSKIFDITIEQLVKINNKKEVIVRENEIIKIPIEMENLIHERSTLSQFNTPTPVVYKTQPKDNLYKLSKVYFQIPMQTLMTINNMDDHNIELDQHLILGWLPHNGRAMKDEIVKEKKSNDIHLVSIKTRPIESQLVPKANNVTKSIYDDSITNSLIDLQLEEGNKIIFEELVFDPFIDSLDIQLIEGKFIGYCDQTVENNDRIYVLNNVARLDSYVELYNSVVQRKLKAKVVGRIPYGAYTPDIELIVSKKAAEEIGILDKRFRIEMKYIK